MAEKFAKIRASNPNLKRTIAFTEAERADLSAAGLSRLYEHMTEGQCGIVSAFRGSYTRETNMKRTKHLKSLLRALYPEVGFITIQGSCQEKAKVLAKKKLAIFLVKKSPFLSIRSKTIALI
ncbi:hypothetical protein [Helicobacter pylori]|uniref:hypothetical protein n=1 Tax=Helicobacter pylori TaxID=210 RepID=UPI001F08A782|nr:hypothetical protein [Helicobacter pylori]